MHGLAVFLWPLVAGTICAVLVIMLVPRAKWWVAQVVLWTVYGVGMIVALSHLHQ